MLQQDAAQRRQASAQAFSWPSSPNSSQISAHRSRTSVQIAQRRSKNSDPLKMKSAVVWQSSAPSSNVRTCVDPAARLPSRRRQYLTVSRQT